MKIDRAQFEAWREAWPAFVARQRKSLAQTRFGWRHPQQTSFVFGCQRSGTKMVMRILDNSPFTNIYHENHSSAFSDFQLRPDSCIRALLAIDPSPCPVFKPICDSQHADRILARFRGSNGLWIYRHPDDVANSAMHKWGEHQRDVVNALVNAGINGDDGSWGWRTADVPPSTVEEIRSVWRPDLNPAEGALLFWYLRNAFFFSLKLDEHPRMRLVNYEGLVREPQRNFPAVFAQVGAPFDAAFVARVRSDSIGKRTAPPAAEAIRALCLGLMDRLDAVAPREAPPPSPVVMLINTLGVGGAERHVVTVANWMADRGSDVTVCSSGGDLVSHLRPAVSHIPTDLYRVRQDLPLAAWRVARVLREKRPVVLLANSLACTLVGRAAAPSGSVPLLNIAHGWPSADYPRVARLMRAADRVIAVSPDVRSRLEAGGLDAERIRVVLNGVDLAGLGPRPPEVRRALRAGLNVKEGELLVIAVGRLTPQKAHQHVIAVAERLRSDAALRFAIAGEGARLDELRALAARAGVDDRVSLLGLRTDVPDLLGAADLYLSTSDWEGLSLTLIEAMASGLPAVATATEGTSLTLGEGTGLLVPPGDVLAMAEGVAKLANDPGLRARLGAAARHRALEHFGHDRMLTALVGVLREAMLPAPGA